MEPPVSRRLVFPDAEDVALAPATRHPGESYVFWRLSFQSLAGFILPPVDGGGFDGFGGLDAPDGDGGRPPRKLMVKCGKRWGSGSEILRHDADCCFGWCSGSAMFTQGHGETRGEKKNTRRARTRGLRCRAPNKAKRKDTRAQRTAHTAQLSLSPFLSLSLPVLSISVSSALSTCARATGHGLESIDALKRPPPFSFVTGVL